MAKNLFGGKETYKEEFGEAKAVAKKKITPAQFVKGEKAEGHKEEPGMKGLAKKLATGKVTPTMYAKKEAKEPMKMSAGGSASSRADGAAKQGKTEGKMVKMAGGGFAMASGALTDSSGDTVRSSDGEEVRYGEPRSSSRPDARREEAKSEEPAKAAQPKFGTAFAEARKAGLKTFEYNGKRYTTQLKDEAPKKAVEAKKEVKEVRSVVPEIKQERVQQPGDEGYGRQSFGEKKSKFAQSQQERVQQPGDEGYGRQSFGEKKSKFAQRQQGSDASMGKNYKKGGSVKSSASSRADGAAKRGRTKGRTL